MMVVGADKWLALVARDLDKPMRGHRPTRAIVGVSGVFRDKPGGLVVHCLRLACV
ncbi:MAG TPA: hypothetical protein PK440_02505 [Candidatus Accumulibacter phosphatis]|nr:MAG: hypothetical protein AW07_01458 [Candidatus Accumulibacter sp. SK-11]HAY29774.1 hypothetical protein [Accumulibacter sp.]HRL75101.1 hypothetical protein [Candidatus Accumulibacter phosphatis]HCN69331.1 hypothetical protein [Accumulibacter sp.]HCV13850.1 hypothetical protein [Accumulibacter sp.]